MAPETASHASATWLDETDVVLTLQRAKQRGLTRFIGWSGKTVEAERRALDWADVMMVEYHADDDSHTAILDACGARGVGVMIKKGLASGSLPPSRSIPFVLGHPAVSTLVVGGLDLGHMGENVGFARAAR